MLQLYYGGQNLPKRVLASYILEAKSVTAAAVWLTVASNLSFAGSSSLAVTIGITFAKLVLALSSRFEVSACYPALDPR